MNWMAALPDVAPLSSLSIPGTHNSAAHHLSLPSVRCQRATVKAQLEHGVRFLDFRVSKPYTVRCLPASPALHFVHGAFPVALFRSATLADALGDVYDFLARNPTETVIVSLKNEGPYSWAPHELATTLWDHYLQPRRHAWFLEPRVPRLGEVRGKAVLFRRFACPPDRADRFGFPFAWRYNTPGDDAGDDTPLAVQDFCELSSPKLIQKKTEYVERHMIRASQTAPQTMFLNFTTAANFWNPGCWPKDVARALRFGIEHALDNTTGRCGVLVLDFADDGNWSIVNRVISRNDNLI